MKLTQTQIAKARNLVVINDLPINRAIALVKRREVRKATRPEYTGSVKKAQAYCII